MKKTIFTCLTIVSLFSTLYAAGGIDIPKDGKPTVATTFNAMTEFVSIVGQDKVHIIPLAPDTVGAHHFEPRAKDLKALQVVDMVVYNGLGMESWIEPAIEATKRNDLIVVNASSKIDAITIHEHDDEHDDEHHTACACGHHHHGSRDPHAWLGLTEAKIMVQTIAEALATLDSANASFYQQNAKEFANEMDSLRSKYRTEIAKKNGKYIIVAHAAFAYLCRDLGLEQYAVRNVFDEGEPSAQNLANMIEFCKKNNISIVFSEHSANPVVSETLAREANAKVEKLYTLELKEENLSLLERQKRNLEHILHSLK